MTPLQTALETASPEHWQSTPDGINGRAGAQTDLFHDPFSNNKVANAPMLLFPVPDGDFILEAAVSVAFASKFDAGVLVLWQDNDNWAKLCFELSPDGQPMVVSVVTREFSDDCNSVAIPAPHVHLRVARRGTGCVFHYSNDRSHWHLVRVFRMPNGPMQAGFLVQSPTGEGTRAVFTGIRFRQETIPDIRSGE